MDKKAILKKVMKKLESWDIEMSVLERLIKAIRIMTDGNQIYKAIHRVLEQYPYTKKQIQAVLKMLMGKEKIQKISPSHEYALKKIVEDFGEDYHSFK